MRAERAPAPARARPVCDVSFAGDWSAMREEIAGKLVAAGVDLRIFGRGGASSPGFAAAAAPRARLLHAAAHGRDLRRCKATLNIHTWRGKFDYGLNPRVFEAAACGTPQLVDWKRELDELFDEIERAAMLVYRSDDELIRRAGPSGRAARKSRCRVDTIHERTRISRACASS
jgi:hypothetical protein